VIDELITKIERLIAEYREQSAYCLSIGSVERSLTYDRVVEDLTALLDE
jgi:hypothetical protein